MPALLFISVVDCKVSGNKFRKVGNSINDNLKGGVVLICLSTDLAIKVCEAICVIACV